MCSPGEKKPPKGGHDKKYWWLLIAGSVSPAWHGINQYPIRSRFSCSFENILAVTAC
jgi:hypothetical protein